MSFLAQLRQKQNPVSPASLQLCYFLRPSAQGAGLCLALRLASVENGLIRELGQPYVLQQAHIQLPPPFFGPSDAALLRELAHHNTAWIGSAEGDLQEADEAFLQRLVTTGKCFNHGTTVALKWGAAVQVTPMWQIDSAGNQCL